MRRIDVDVVFWCLLIVVLNGSECVGGNIV